MITPSALAIILQGAPFPGAVFTVTPGGAALDLTIGDETITFCEGAWFAAERRTTPAHLSFAATPTAEQVHTEIRRVLAIVNAPADDPLYDRAAAEQALAKITDAHAVVSQRLIGSQKEVAEVTERATKAEARVKRLLRQRAAAHAVLDEAAIGLEVEGSPRWTLARRCRAAVEPVWGYLDVLQAFDVLGEIVGVTGKTGERGFIDAVIARVKALHQDDADLLRLVSYHQAPIAFNARPLTLAERAAFVIRRLWQGRTNAANEATSLRRELSDIADALGDLPDTAEREPIGDREEHLGLSTAERIRLSR